MWAKILAGTLAAVAVTGTGVYFAMPGHCSHGCKGSITSAEMHSCCPMPCERASTCTEALAACVGPAAMVSADEPTCHEGSRMRAKGACCQD
jgi:hypothetical protein